MPKPTTIYDAVAYPGHPYAQTHPDHLAVLAKLHGMTPASADRCRVLELACGDGANLIPMALTLPESEFLGIDLASAPILRGRERIARLGLCNIRLEDMDLVNFAQDAGPFDYVIAHGLYSWVPPSIQAKILEIVEHSLAPQGVAYISYNAMPGGHIRLMMREIMLFHARKFEEPVEKVRQARGLVQMLANAQKQPNRYGTLLLEEWEENVSVRHPQALFHDELGDCNENIYFHEFMDRATEHRLQFLCEASYAEMQANGIKEEIKDILKGLGDDVIAREQYLDFMVGRRFRQTLLCRDNIHVDRNKLTEKVEELSIAGNVRPKQPVTKAALEGEIKFIGPKDTSVMSTHPLLTTALSCLGNHWPAPLPFNTLWETVQKQLSFSGLSESNQPEHRTALARALLNCYGLGLVELRAWTPPLTAEPGDCPVSSPLARLQSLSADIATTLLHTSVELSDSLAKTLLQLLDGSRNRSEIIKWLTEAVVSGKAALLVEGKECHDPAMIRQTIDTELNDHLKHLARLGLLCRKE